jgi:hypothetical protein
MDKEAKDNFLRKKKLNLIRFKLNRNFYLQAFKSTNIFTNFSLKFILLAKKMLFLIIRTTFYGLLKE